MADQFTKTSWEMQTKTTRDTSTQKKKQPKHNTKDGHQNIREQKEKLPKTLKTMQ